MKAKTQIKFNGIKKWFLFKETVTQIMQIRSDSNFASKISLTCIDDSNTSYNLEIDWYHLEELIDLT